MNLVKVILAPESDFVPYYKNDFGLDTQCKVINFMAKQHKKCRKNCGQHKPML